MIPVMLLINCSSVILLKTNGYVGLSSIKFIFQYPKIHLYSEGKKKAFILVKQYVLKLPVLEDIILGLILKFM